MQARHNFRNPFPKQELSVDATEILWEEAREPDAAMRTRLDAGGARPSSFSPVEFAAFVRSEREDWGKVVKQAGIVAQ